MAHNHEVVGSNPTPATLRTMNNETVLPAEQIPWPKQTKKIHSIPKYIPVFSHAKEGQTPRVIGRKWAGPRHKMLSGTAKQAARHTWDQMRSV